MSPTDQLRNSIIEKLLSIRDQEYLAALYQLLKNSTVEEDIIPLSEEQKHMLKISDEDIKAGRVTEHDELYQKKLRWLKGK